METMIRGVLFDMDGVLVDTENIGLRVMPEEARAMGYDFPNEMYYQVLGCNRTTSKQILSQTFGADFPYEELDRRFFMRLLKIAEAGELPLKKGYRECMDGLRARGIRRALATSSHREVWEAYAKHNPALQNVFDATVCGLEVPRGKPEPDIYQIAAQKLALAPNECVGVEDSRNGVRSLRAAGCHSVMIPDLLQYDESLAPYVDTRLDDLSQLCALVDRLNGEARESRPV